MPDYIPGADGNFDAWQINFLAYATANAAALGLDPLVDIPPLAAAQGVWTTDFAANTAAQAAAQAARQGKDTARDTYEGLIRPLVARLQASSEVDDTERAALGITVPDRVPTPVGAPETRPVVKIDDCSISGRPGRGNANLPLCDSRFPSAVGGILAPARPFTGPEVRIRTGIPRSRRGADDPLQGVGNRRQGAHQSLQGADDSLQGADDPLQGADDSLPGAADPLQGADDVLQGADGPLHSAA